MNNEDKKIREELIELIGCMHDADPRKERWLSWLEKQGGCSAKWEKNATDNKKEVDLNKEIEKEIETRWYGEYLSTEKFKESAKHFFELGLKVKKGE